MPFGTVARMMRSEYLTLDYMIERVKNKDFALRYTKQVNLVICGNAKGVELF